MYGALEERAAHGKPVHLTEISWLFELRSPAGSNQAGLGLAVDKKGTVALWKAGAAAGAATSLFSLGGAPDVVALSDDGALLASAERSVVKLYSLPKGKEVKTLTRLKARVTALDFQPSAPTLVIGSADGRIYRWRYKEDVEGASEKELQHSLERYIGPANVIAAIDYHPGGRVFFSGDWSGGLNGWLNYEDAELPDTSKGRERFGGRFFGERVVRMRAPRPEQNAIEHLTVSEDGEWILVAVRDGTLEWWQVRGIDRLGTTKAHQGPINALAVSPDSTIVATGGRDGKVRRFKLEKTPPDPSGVPAGKLTLLKEESLPGVSALSFAEDGRLMAATTSGSLQVMDRIP